MGVTNDALAPLGQDTTEPADIDVKLEMISDSYAEVLDATKHQDDKVGQLLTSIAFLTAATLALAALESGDFITRTFVVSPYKLPLGLIALIVFLVGVAWSVMLLLVSLSTPLRVPGLTRTRKANPMTWVNGVPASQIYFYEMSRVSVDEWEKKWSSSAETLKKERLRSLVRETHNLGVRTSAKYDRTTEAVGLLSLSLLAFALSIIFVAIVAATPGAPQPVILSLWQRIIAGVTFGCYGWFQVLGQVRYNRLAVDETPPRERQSPERRKYRAELCYAVLTGLLMIDILWYDGSWPGLGVWIAATAVLTLGYLTAFVLANPVAAASPVANAAPRWYARYRGWILMITVTLSLVAATLLSGVNGWFAGQLGVVSFAVLLLIGTAILVPTFTARANTQRYWARQESDV